MYSTKLEKINGRLYSEIDSDDSESLKWFKALQNVYVDVSDITLQANYILEPKNRESSFWEEAKKNEKLTEQVSRIRETNENNYNKADLEVLSKINDDLAERCSSINKHRKIARSIKGKALFNNFDIVAIKNGQSCGSKEAFKTADFICHEGEGFGFLMHSESGEFDKTHFCDHLIIETYLPEDLFDSLYNQINYENKEVAVGLEVDLFQCEMDRSLGNPSQHGTFALEHQSSFNTCGISGIYFQNIKQTAEKDNSDDDIILNEPNELESKKTRALFKIMVGLTRRLDYIICALFVMGLIIILS
jgi:hypothetical protein